MYRVSVLYIESSWTHVHIESSSTHVPFFCTPIFSSCTPVKRVHIKSSSTHVPRVDWSLRPHLCHVMQVRPEPQHVEAIINTIRLLPDCRFLWSLPKEGHGPSMAALSRNALCLPWVPQVCMHSL